MSTCFQRLRVCVLLLAPACVLPTFALPARADVTYVLHDLGTFGGRYAEARAVNEAGVIVGNYFPAGTYESYAFFWDGEFHDLGPGSAHDINNSGVIVGTSGGNVVRWLGGVAEVMAPGGAVAINDSGHILAGRSGHAFLLVDGAEQDLNALTGKVVSPRDLNSADEIAGVLEDSGPYFTYYRAFLLAGGQFTDIGTLSGGKNSQASAINDHGVVVGYSEWLPPGIPFPETHAFVWDGQLHDLGPGYATDINNAGQVVGGAGGACIWSDGEMTMLPDLGVSAGALGMNDLGVVVGFSWGQGQMQRAVYWTPVPEPSTAAAMGALIAAMAVSQSRRRRIR